jgi:hypothetical protein
VQFLGEGQEDLDVPQLDHRTIIAGSLNSLFPESLLITGVPRLEAEHRSDSREVE